MWSKVDLRVQLAFKRLIRACDWCSICSSAHAIVYVQEGHLRMRLVFKMFIRACILYVQEIHMRVYLVSRICRSSHVSYVFFNKTCCMEWSLRCL